MYRGPGIAEGTRSLAFRLRFCSLDHTLTDDEVGELRTALYRGRGEGVRRGPALTPGSVTEFEEAQHRQDPPVVGLGHRQVELGEDVGDVLFDRPLGDHELLGDGRVGAALGHQGEHLSLPGAQHRDGVGLPGGPQQLGHHLGIERGPPRGDPTQGLDEVAHVGHPVLQQVADPGRVVGQQLGRVAGLDVLGEQQDARGRGGGGGARWPPAAPRR